MRLTLSILAVLSVNLLSFAQIKVIDQSNTESVDLYNGVAHVKRSFSISGSGLYFLDNVGADIMVESIEFTGPGNIQIHNVQFTQKDMDPADYPKEAQKIESALRTRLYDLETRKQMQEVYQAEKDLILSNKNVLGNGADVTDLSELLSFVRPKLKELNLKLFEVKEEKKIIQKDIQELRFKLQQLGGTENLKKGSIGFQINHANGPAQMEVSYLLRGAYWSPIYHITDHEDGSLTISKKASIQNRTTEHWNNATVALRSGSPAHVSTLPQLNPWVIQYRNPQYKQKQKQGNYQQLEVVNDAIYEISATASPDFSDVGGVSYPLGDGQSIPAGASTEIEIESRKVNVVRTYLAVPKMNLDVFIQGFVDVTPAELENGQIWIYRKGRMVGKTYISSIENGKVKLSLGRAENITVDRKEIAEADSEGGVLSSTKIRKTFEFTISSNASASLPLEIRDQLPVSNSEDIEVLPFNLQDGKLNGETGELTWRIQPNGGVQKIRYSYTIKHPKGYQISH